MYKSKRQKNKSFDWYGLSQRFSIRKYHFGAASVLLGTALILGAAQTTAKAEETATENKTEAVASAPKDDKASENVANVTTPALSATTKAAVVEKPSLSDEEVAKLAAEASKKDEKASEIATTEKTEAADKEKATLTAPSTDKKADKAVDEKADKKDEKKAENPIAATKTVLEQLTSEAEVLNTSASNFADKKAEDKAGKEAIATAVASAKVQIEASKKALAAGEITKQELDAQLQRISSAIEAVYAEMKRAGHVGKVEAVLPGETGTTVAVNNPINKVVVSNFGAITDEEARAIEKEIRTANPTLTPEDKIEITTTGASSRAVAKITLANGKVDQFGRATHEFRIGDLAFGTAGQKNFDQLREAINWFDFARASITYSDGTKVGAIEYVDNAPQVQFTSSKGRQETGRFTMVRTVLESTTHPELVGKKTNSAEFIASGLAKYTLWKNYHNINDEVINNKSSGRNENEIYEALQEGMRFDVPTKVKGYTLSATVSSLSRKKVDNEALTLNKANGEPENINRNTINGQVQREDVILTKQDQRYSHLRVAGFETTYVDSKGVKREGLTAFAPAYDGGNVGVKFELSATYNGRPVAVNAIAADAEDLTANEFTQFETDGTPWEEFMRLNKNKTDSKGLVPMTPIGDFYNGTDRVTKTKYSLGYNENEWKNKTESGYGSQLFGPFNSGVDTGNDLPIGLSQNVEHLGVYVNAAGSQSATVGFVIYDGGDAPASYGSAQHIIGNFNKTVNGNQVVATQPYLGDVPADTDFRTTTAEPNGAWVLDDLVNSEDYKEISLVSGQTDVTNSKGQSGKYVLDGKNPVIRMSDGTQVAIKNGEILSTANTLKGGDNLPIKGLYNQATRGLGVGNLPDEGENQLLDPAVATKYTLRHASENEYTLKGVRVNRGVNNDVAYVRGWVDFNGNGKFDLYESSELVTANADGTYDITFKNAPQLLNTSVDNLGVRLRISVDERDLRLPTGLASSGEVEDFVANVIHPPRGTRHETKDFQGRKQEVNFPTNAMFTASGKTIESNYKQWAQIDNNTAPKMVLNDTVVKSEEPTGKTVEVKDKLSQTIYNGTEVVVKDARGNTLGTAVKVTNKLTGKTEYYLSEYTEYDTAGNKVGVYKLNEGSAEGKNTTQGSLSFTKITFQPEAGFVGTAKGVAIRAWDDNGSHTGWEATEDTIKESLTSTTLADKDKILENVNNGNNGAKSMDTSYIPTVIDVRPVGENTTTEDVQGKTQKSNPTIPVYGTVETVTNDKVEDVKYTADYVILDKTKKPTFATRKETPSKLYTEDTKVDKETTLTLTDGTTVTYKPVDKIPAGTTIANTGDVNVTGTGNVSVNNIRLVKGTLIPAGAKPQSNHPAPVEVKVTLANGTEQTIPAGGTIPAGATINTPFTNSANNTFDNVTYNTGQTIPRESGNKISTLANETSADQLVEKGKSITLGGTTYSNNDVIPKGTRTATTYEDLTPNTPLPNAVHIDPETGEVTSVPRRYTKVTDTEIVIENEGTYTLNQDTGEITFTPVPKFVGTGTGVTKQQPDVDYNDKVAGDPVTSKYGTDYGKATYTPIVKPQSKASITRTIHYVYENADDNPTNQDSYKDNDPIVAIDNTPVTRKQTIDYTRDYKIFSEAGTTDSAITTTNQVTDATGHVYKVGDTIPAGTKFNQGTIIIGKWTASSDENSKFKEIISPTVKGYTAEVVTANFTPNADGKMGHIHNGKQPVGLYTPVADNTKDVGAYEPLVSEVRSDDKDDFDMYVVYKADTQKAKVTYIDLDATGDDRILEVQNANPAPATGADEKTTYGVTTLQGKSHTAIPYTTAETIKKYEDLGYELVTDDYTNNTQGTAIEGGRKFDDDKEVDQAFNVYLRHKKVTRKIKDTQEVTRTIEYKYASTDDVPADKRGTTAAPTVTETLHFERDRTIDYTLAAKEYPTEYAAYKAVLDKSGYDSPEEYKARVVYYDHITNKAIAADATDVQKSIVTFGPWTPVGGTSNDAITLSDAEKAKDDKFNNVPSPKVAGYTPDKVSIDKTGEIDAEAADYTVEVLYTPEKQRATVKFVESDANGTVKTVSNGVDVALADALTETGASGTNFTTLNQAKVDEVIKNLEAKGYTLVSDGFKAATANTAFDTDKATDQEFVVKLTPKVVEVPSFDPTKPQSDDNPKPEPGKPVDPTKPDGPKWPSSVKDLKNTDTVKRTVKYVFENGAPVIDSATGNQKVVEQEVKFTRTSSVNLVTGEITYGDWTAAQELPAVTSPTETDIPAVTNHIPSTKTVPAVTVKAEGEDLTETVVYRKIDSITVQPNDPTPTKDTPIDPNNPDGPKWTEELIKKLEDARKEEVNRTITYKYSDVESELKPADTAKKGADVASEFTTKVEFKRAITVDPVTGDFTYGPWKATNDDTTLEGKSELPVVTGYVATGDVDSSKKDVTDVNATDKDITEKVVYKAVGNYVPVIPEGITPPANVNVDPKPYTNDPQDGSKVKDPDPTNPVVPGTTTPIVPQIPGTTPVGPDGKPLKPVDPNDPSKGYIPPTPTDPTKDTSIIYVKDGSQVAVTHFIEVNSETDKTEKGGVATSVVDTGDTGKPFTKSADVTATIESLKAKGYTVVENNYPTDGKFDADSKTNQVYKVLVTVKPITVTPNDSTPEPGKPIDPNNPTGPKWTPELIKELEDGRKEEVKRTIKYVYVDGTKAADTKEETKNFSRSATINPVTGKITFGDWSPAQTFEAVTSPEIKNYTPNKATVPASEVTATAEDINETVVYTTKPLSVDPTKPVDPNTPDVTPKPEDKVPNDPKGRTYKELGLIEEVTHTVHYKLADGSDAGIPDNVQTLTFTRTADLDPVTGAISNYGTWTPKDGDTTIDAITTPNKPGYVASAAKSTARENVKATDKDSEETIIYRKLGSYVPVIPEGVTPPAGTDLTPKPYETPTNEDPTKPGTPTETPVVPYIPGTTPVGPDGKPLTPKDPNDPTKGYEVPKVPEDPTQNTTITYVKDGSQVALVHFIKADGTAVHVSVAEAGDTGKAIKTTNIDSVKAELEAKGYEVVAPTDPAYTAERVAFYAEANRTFDDKDDKGNSGISQVYYVIVKEGISPIDPDKPLDPNNPNTTPKPGDKVPGDPKQRTFEQLGLLDEVNRTINYRYANTDKVEEAKRGQEAAATVEQKLRYSRKGDLNKVTGEITYTSDWTKPQTLAEVVSPVIEGYVADIKAAEKVENVAHDAADSVVNVVYSPLGKYVPKVPEGFEVPKVEKPQYPNDPTDPTKPGTPTTVIPHVPGTTPKDPNGNPLKPVDPNDPSKGYVPPTPENPTEDTEITYEKDTQKATVTYVVEGTGKVLHTDNLKGKSGDPIEYSTVAKLAELKALGYDLVSDGFSTATDKNYDKDTKVDQSFVVTVTPHVEPIKPVDPTNPNDPNKPKPGDPIDPKNPDGPKWTEDLIKKIDTTRHVNRTITYVNEKGEEVAEKVTDKVTFTREAKINAVTGVITYGDWVAKDGDTTFDKVESPVVKGYILKDAKQKEVAATTGLTADSKDENIEVVYTKLGSWVPKVPEGVTPIDPIPYPNDPKDPTKPGSDRPIVPYVPGTTPKDPNGNPLKPVDPNDPTKGYEVPPVPTEPGKDIEINYVKDEQRATVKYVVEGTGTVLHTDNLKGKSGEPIEYSTVAKLAELKALGYDLVTDGFTTATDKNFDKDSSKDQEYTVVLTQHSEPLKPVDPENPNDPNRPKPGQPIDPNNPDGPKWTEDLIKKIDTTRHVNRTITYVDEKGNRVTYTDKAGKDSTESIKDKVTFTREAKINAVTGVITYGDWVAKDGDTTFDKVESPVVKGYILKDAKQKEVAATTGLTADSKDENIEVVYTKLGSWVPKVPEGVTPIDPIPYPNDPKDPTKPGNDRPIVPYVPGTTPVVPKDPTKPISPDNPLVPLTPVDPNDPTKGYEVPPVPTDPRTDTPITYVTDKQKAITNFVDEKGKVVSTPVVDEGDSGANFTKSKVDEVTKTIEKLEKAGYRVVKNEFPSKDTDRVFDKDKSVDQIFNVTVAERIIPVTPGKPVDPNDPNLPKNPDGTPVTPSTPEPGKPVFPNDPNSPVWPSTVKDLVTEKGATRTIKYVDRNGKEVTETRVETIKFTRDAKINLVTGEITYGEWTTDRNDDIFNGYPVPVVKGYIAKDGDLESSTKDVKVTPDTIKDINETVVYDKLGSWVPNIPGTPTNPIPYPNDPKDPTKPGSDKPIVPYVPGHTPMVPQDPTKPVGPNNPLVPLKPVDPNDPTKGYEVPNVPNDPTKDTPISYVPVPQPTPKPTPTTPVTPETPKAPEAPVAPKAPTQVKRLANTGTTETNTGLAGLGMAIFGGLLAAARRRKNNED